MDAVDLVIVGGGLAGSLLALTLREKNPDLRLLLIEQGARLGGNHRWSYFTTDLDEAGHRLLAGIEKKCWPAYDVRFPAYARRVETGYQSFDDAALDAWVRATLPGNAILSGQPVAALAPNQVVLASQKVITAHAVVDARGAREAPGMELGWQKFVGCSFAAPGHGLTAPIIMDACVDQRDGYRFVYTLPLSDDLLFVEDTYYTSGPALDDAAVRAEVIAYAKSLGAQGEPLSEERGVLPIVIDGAPAQFGQEKDGPAKIGMAAGMFHPLTGYSLPLSVKAALDMADQISAGQWPDSAQSQARTKLHWKKTGYYRMLAKMLFNAADPDQRYRVFEHFYTMPHAMIERFYAGQPTLADKARLLIGKPPVPVSRALSALLK